MSVTAKQFAVALVRATEGATKSQVEKAVREVLGRLSPSRRPVLVPHIIRALDAAWRARFGASRVRVTSARPLPEAEVARLKRLAPGADFERVVDASLIGGAVVRLDDRLIDGSVSGALARLNDSLIHGS